MALAAAPSKSVVDAGAVAARCEASIETLGPDAGCRIRLGVVERVDGGYIIGDETENVACGATVEECGRRLHCACK
jgi:hypothetical protein